MHACLADNIWGTNYVMWQPYGPEGRDMRFRFVLQARGVPDSHMQRVSVFALQYSRLRGPVVMTVKLKDAGRAVAMTVTLGLSVQD